jgi:hypothetical protein
MALKRTEAGFRPSSVSGCIRDELFGNTVRFLDPSGKNATAPAASIEALRASIEDTSQPSVAAHIQGSTFKTDEEWVALISSADLPAAEAADDLAGAARVRSAQARHAGLGHLTHEGNRTTFR